MLYYARAKRRGLIVGVTAAVALAAACSGGNSRVDLDIRKLVPFASLQGVRFGLLPKELHAARPRTTLEKSGGYGEDIPPYHVRYQFNDMTPTASFTENSTLESVAASRNVIDVAVAQVIWQLEFDSALVHIGDPLHCFRDTTGGKLAIGATWNFNADIVDVGYATPLRAIAGDSSHTTVSVVVRGLQDIDSTRTLTPCDYHRLPAQK